MSKIQQLFVLILILLFTISPLLVFASTTGTYTQSEVAAHNSLTSCWMSFENNVYDITTYVSSHDKYMDISSWCGKDITQDFMTKAGMGVDHKASSYNLLEIYKIGTLNSVPIVSTNVPSITSTTNPSAVNTTTEDELYSVEIEGDVMKTLTIQQIADLWEIDAKTLLTQIINTYKFKGPYTIDTKLDQMRVEYKFSPSQIKDIAEGIKTGQTAALSINNLNVTPSVTATNRAPSTNPYNFGIPFFGSLGLYLLTYFFSKSKFGARYLSHLNFNFLWNSVLVLTLIPSGVFGFYLVLRYPFPELAKINFDFMYWHVEGSIIFATIAFTHLIQRLKQYLVPIKLWQKSPTIVLPN